MEIQVEQVLLKLQNLAVVKNTILAVITLKKQKINIRVNCQLVNLKLNLVYLILHTAQQFKRIFSELRMSTKIFGLVVISIFPVKQVQFHQYQVKLMFLNIWLPQITPSSKLVVGQHLARMVRQKDLKVMTQNYRQNIEIIVMK